MKNIKELGLELIQLEDQVLLVDKNSKIIGGDWYYNSYYNTVDRRDGYVSVSKSIAGITVSKVISSTKPLKGLPLLVIEDDVEKWINESTSTLKDVHTINISKMCLNAGYKKAKETYKYTEEDLRRAYNQGGRDMHDRCISHNWRGVYQSVDINEFSKLRQNFLQSLTKKELWIEVEFKETKSSVFRENDAAPYGIYEPKIINNQIKAVWK